MIRYSVIALENVGPSARTGLGADLTIFMIQYVLLREDKIEEL